LSIIWITLQIEQNYATSISTPATMASVWTTVWCAMAQTIVGTTRMSWIAQVRRNVEQECFNVASDLALPVAGNVMER